MAIADRNERTNLAGRSTEHRAQFAGQTQTRSLVDVVMHTYLSSSDGNAQKRNSEIASGTKKYANGKYGIKSMQPGASAVIGRSIFMC